MGKVQFSDLDVDALLDVQSSDEHGNDLPELERSLDDILNEDEFLKDSLPDEEEEEDKAISFLILSRLIKCVLWLWLGDEHKGTHDFGFNMLIRNEIQFHSEEEVADAKKVVTSLRSFSCWESNDRISAAVSFDICSAAAVRSISKERPGVAFAAPAAASRQMGPSGSAASRFFKTVSTRSKNSPECENNPLNLELSHGELDGSKVDTGFNTTREEMVKKGANDEVHSVVTEERLDNVENLSSSIESLERPRRIDQCDGADNKSEAQLSLLDVSGSSSSKDASETDDEEKDEFGGHPLVGNVEQESRDIDFSNNRNEVMGTSTPDGLPQSSKCPTLRGFKRYRCRQCGCCGSEICEHYGGRTTSHCLTTCRRVRKTGCQFRFTLGGTVCPQVMQALVEHYNSLGWLNRVEQCVLHMDIASLDFNQVVRVCRDHGLYSALIYIFTKGLDDFKSPLEELLAVAQHSNDPQQARGYGLKLLVYVKYCFSGLAFPPGKGTLSEARLPQLRTELLQYLLEVMDSEKEVGPERVGQKYSRLLYLLTLETQATLRVLGAAFPEDGPLGVGKRDCVYPLTRTKSEEDALNNLVERQSRSHTMPNKESIVEGLRLRWLRWQSMQSFVSFERSEALATPQCQRRNYHT